MFQSEPGVGGRLIIGDGGRILYIVDQSIMLSAG